MSGRGRVSVQEKMRHLAEEDAMGFRAWLVTWRFVNEATETSQAFEDFRAAEHKVARVIEDARALDFVRVTETTLNDCFRKGGR